MGWWIVTLKSANKAPYIEKCKDEEDADSRIARAESEGLAAEKYHTGSDDIYSAKQHLRDQITRDFGYNTGNSNFRRKEDV